VLFRSVGEEGGEQAISGVSSVAFPSDANYNLVSGNGVSDEARNAVLVMTGTLSATRDLIVPTSNKFYAVRNATTGGQSIIVKTAAGTGVTLANGFTQLMYCDGTNVVLASIPINSANGNVAVGGDLAVGGNLAVAGGITSGGGIIMPTGSILEYGGTAEVTGWLLCDGAAVSRATYASLFAILGTAYGAGDGSTTFNVPDRRDRVGVGAGTTYTRGQTGGAATATTSTDGAHSHGGATAGHTLTEAQMPSHTHTGTTNFAADHVHTYQLEDLSGAGTGGPGFSFSNQFVTGTTGAAGGHDHTFSTNATGSNQAHSHTINSDGNHNHTVSTISPYVASNYIIKT
jgi:microcystin-dependent protein